jgi:hypothetical protein
MNVLAEVAAATEPLLGVHALGEPGPPRFDGNLFEPERLFVLEAVYEGYLMHYGSPRAFAGMDDDLCLLAGDALYALGLRRLADAGDLEAVAELADLISACARAHAEGRAEDAEALWEESARVLSLSPRRR